MSSILAVLAAAAVAGNVAVYEEVGSQAQACDPNTSAHVFEKSERKVALMAGIEAEVQLPQMTSEFYWYCGDQPHRADSKVWFNTARAEREESGEVIWQFYIDWSR